MLMDTKLAKDDHGERQTYFRVAFDPEETRYLGSHLKGAVPKLKFTGEIGQGLIMFFDGDGKGLRQREGKMEALINASYVVGFQGERPPIQPTYERQTYQGKPAFYLHPIHNYDRDADKVERRTAADTLFNPVIAPEPAAPAPAPAPKLSKTKVAEIAARHANEGVPPIAADRLTPANKENGAPPSPSAATIPKRASTEGVVRDIRDIAAMLNEVMDQSDDLVLRAIDDGRHIQIVRRRVVEEMVI